jgi:hypothetical protein
MTDKIRLQEKLRINEEVRISTIYNDADRATLLKLRGMNSMDIYVQTQMKKVTEALDTRVKKLTELEDRIDKLEKGELDDELINSMKETAREIKEKGDLTITRKKEEKTVDVEVAKKSKDFYQQERQAERINKESYYKGALKHFSKSCDSIPEYMTRELNKMPSNQGYVWRGVYCFGSRNPTSKVDYKVTENQKGKKIITYWNKTHITVFEKIGPKGKETLISSVVRKNR